MYHKIVTFIYIILAAVFVQSMTSPIEENQISNAETHSILELIESYDAKFSMHGIWIKVKESLISTIPNVAGLKKGTIKNISSRIDDFDAISISENAEAQHKMIAIMNKQNNTFYNLLLQAKQLGKDVSACLKERKTDIEQVTKEITGTIVTCTLDKSKSAKEMIRNIITIINKTWNLKQTIGDVLSRCKRSATTSEELSCLTLIPHEIILYVMRIKDYVTKIVDNFDITINETKMALKRCIIHNIGDISMAIIDEGSNITSCIQQKLKEDKNNTKDIHSSKSYVNL